MRNDVHVLIGADYANHFLLEKPICEGEAAWKTALGWVLSGPEQCDGTATGGTSSDRLVSFVQADIQ